MKNKEMQWALYPWFNEHGDDLIHPDDIESFIKITPSLRMFRVLPPQEEWSAIKYGENIFRVDSILLKIIPPCGNIFFEIGEKVKIVGGEELALVEGNGWHHAKNSPFYILRINGKVRSRRYWPDELQRT